ncbi:MAG: UDP-N-acetylmuramate--L-alanine ligase [Planctomycetota bacterium]|jgi:UDP-N-acetylmuramate--alanine ligase
MAGKHYHLIGIGGTGMSGLARILGTMGHCVTGSDIVETEITRALAGEGICVSSPHAGKNLPGKCDMVICSAAVPASNPELKAARKRKIKVRKYAEMLGDLMDGKTGIAFAGTHGKTTSASLAAHVFATAGADPSFLIGGELSGYNTNARAGSGEHFVVEACEYGRSFLNLSPKIAVITNIESDHLDYYRNLNEIIGAFHEFASRLPESGLVVINGEDENAAWAVKDIDAEVQTIGFDTFSDWTARVLPSAAGRTRFMAQFRGKVLGVADLGLLGEHNVANALGVIAALYHSGIRGAEILNGMSTFRGVRRRFEIISGKLPITVIDDYAHHPTEISSVIKSARLRFPGKQIWALFQPHQYSRTRFFFEEFAQSLVAADFVIIPNIFEARDSDKEKKSVSPRDLVNAIRKRGGDAEFTNGFEGALELLEEELTSDVVLLTMGAGDVNLVAYEFCRRQAG